MTSAAPTLSTLSILLPSSPAEGRPQRKLSTPGTGQRRRRSPRTRLLQLGLFVLATLGHLAALAFIIHLSQRPVEVPQLASIAVALIEAEPLAEPAPEPAIEPVVEPRPETPPPPEAVKEPPPPQVPEPKPEPKPQPKPKPAPKPKPKPAPEPVVRQTESPTALQQETAVAEAVEEAAEAASPPQAPSSPPPPAAAASRPAAAAPLRTTEARYDAAYLNNPAPTYPAVSRRLREEGQVMLRVLVSVDGQPKNIELRTSSGSERLDKAAMAAVARWRFVAAKRGDQAVEAWVLVPIVFKLTGN